MKRPELKKNQFALIVADRATGHVYNTDLEISVDDQKPIYFTFDSMQDAKDFVLKLKQANNTYEYVIYNENYELICVLE